MLLIIPLLTNFYCFGENVISVNVKTFGAIPSDGKDDTQSFQKGINYLALNKGGTLIIPKGSYNITHLKFLGKKYSNITIVGDSSIILQTLPKERSLLANGFKTYAERNAADGCFVFDAEASNQINDLHSIKNITIRGLNFVSNVGTKGFDELLHQVSAHGVSNFKVENCNFIGFHGDGIAINGATDFSKNRNAYNKNINIKNCKFDGLNNDNRQGISIYYSDGFVIDNCHFQNVTRGDMPGAIDIEPDMDANVSRNGKITNCTFKNIKGIAAIHIVIRKSSAENNFSNKNFLIDNCKFENVNSSVGIAGNDQFLTFNKAYKTVIFKNSTVKNAYTLMEMRKAFGVEIDNVKFENIRNEYNNVVSDGGAKDITFKNCLFDGIKNPNGLGFTGITFEINFLNNVFKNFESNAITINAISGVGKISKNQFLSTKNKGGFPLITQYYTNKVSVKQAVINENKSSGNFTTINLNFFKK